VETDLSQPAKPNPPAPKETLTPLMQQYQTLKARYPEEVLLFRLGDFYEMFHDDAKKAAPILDVALTHRQQVPMCGVPAHSVDPYIAKLLKAGVRVAIADQMEDPASTKGIVRRDVVRVMTPGTLQEDTLLPSRQSNYLVAVCVRMEGIGLAALECSTGEFLVTQIPATAPASAGWDEIIRLAPSEVILEASSASAAALKERLQKNGFAVAELSASDYSTAMASERLKGLFGTASLRGFGLEDKPLAISAAGAAVRYMENTQCGRPFTIRPLRTYSLEDTLQIDAATLEHLDLIGAARSGGKSRTLLEIIDQTLTPMGGRLIRRWLVSPLRQVGAIQERQQFVEFHTEGKESRRHLRAFLQGFPDIERILARLTAGTVAPRDLASLSQGLRRASKLKTQLAAAFEQRTQLGLSLPPALEKSLTAFPENPALEVQLEQAVVEAPPATLKDGGVIRSGYNVELDEVRTWIHEGKNKLLDLEKREREASGIGSLKISFNSVFGYYLEVTKTHLSRVPAHYIRKQTTANGERYITPELKEFETRLLGAQERGLRLETALVQTLREEILKHQTSLRTIALAIAELDVCLSLAEVAERRHYVKPTVDDSDRLFIRDGRHPVLEDVLASGTLVPNDTDLDGLEKQIVILTGPNMSGKSTYLRQTALIVILAQIGSYVPAAEAHIGVVDRLFTRIGASDRLSEGESTFMVEMVETARILHPATPRSFVILDEVGRGTSTYDGMSIAWACLEYLHQDHAKPGPKVLFATHYFELTQLAHKLPGIRNAHVSAREWNDTVVFLHKVEPGPADRAYGIHVARLAGLPKQVLERANVLLKEFEKNGSSKKAEASPAQPLLFSETNLEPPVLAPAETRNSEAENDRLVADALRALELNQLTPLQALLTLQEFKDRLSGKKEPF
jgi:DNA mismatch repair protein MutS